jgi:hypothetical protein
LPKGFAPSVVLAGTSTAGVPALMSGVGSGWASGVGSSVAGRSSGFRVEPDGVSPPSLPEGVVMGGAAGLGVGPAVENPRS